VSVPTSVFERGRGTTYTDGVKLFFQLLYIDRFYPISTRNQIDDIALIPAVFVPRRKVSSPSTPVKSFDNVLIIIYISSYLLGR
jgi:hypothetical protein